MILYFFQILWSDDDSPCTDNERENNNINIKICRIVQLTKSMLRDEMNITEVTQALKVGDII